PFQEFIGSFRIISFKNYNIIANEFLVCDSAEGFDVGSIVHFESTKLKRKSPSIHAHLSDPFFRRGSNSIVFCEEPLRTVQFPLRIPVLSEVRQRVGYFHLLPQMYKYRCWS